MQRTLFKKYLRITSLVIIVSFFLLSFVLLVAISSYWQSEKKDLLRKNAESVAKIASDSVITVNQNEYQVDGVRMQTFILAFADNINADIFVTKQDGQTLLAAYGSGGNVDSTRRIGPKIMNKALSGGYSAEGTMDGFYNQRYYIVGVPISVLVKGAPVQIGAVFAASSVKAFNAFRLDILKMILFAGLAAFAISFCVIWLFSYKLVQPLRNMAAAARCFGEGNFSVRVPVTSQDEIGQLAVAFNNMADSLASSEHVRRDFIANVSHELKTPMTTIAGFIDGILDGTIPPEKQSHYLGIVSQEVKRLSRLVRTMLDLSRIDSGELRLRPARFDLTGVVLSVMLSFEQAIENKKIEVRGLENAESLFVDGDPDMIHQVVYNLVDNAVKFTNEGGYIEIELRDEEDRTVVSVENSGDGISPDELPMVFERFYKTDKSRSQDRKGMGLGLYIVKTIIRLHGGEISAKSVWHENCRFEFWLPKHLEETPETPDGQRRLVETHGEEPKEKPQKK